LCFLPLPVDDLFVVMKPFFLDVDGSGVKNFFIGNLVVGGDTASPNPDSETNRKNDHEQLYATVPVDHM
ncbi:MAG: hypothetical protein AAGM46_28245, partial [Cyanobacteria bacterium J06582_2]